MVSEELKKEAVYLCVASYAEERLLTLNMNVESTQGEIHYDFQSLFLDSGCRLLDAGLRMQASGCRPQDAGFLMQASKCPWHSTIDIG